MPVIYSNKHNLFKHFKCSKIEKLAGKYFFESEYVHITLFASGQPNQSETRENIWFGMNRVPHQWILSISFISIWFT